MARFDVYKLEGPTPLVIDVQSDLLSKLQTRVVVPLISLDRAPNEPMPRLRPQLKLQSIDYIMSTSELAAIPTSDMRECIGNLESERGAIVDAIDFLLQGF